MNDEPRGKPLGDYLGALSVSFGEQTDFGLSLTAILSGAEIPAGGARIDVPVSGTTTGPAMDGTVVGVDHLDVRPGLQVIRHLHLAFFMSDGGRLAATGEGVVTPSTSVPVTDLRIALLCRSVSPTTKWMDGQTVWAVGSVDPFAGHVTADLYLAAGVAGGGA